jgi:predicted RNase H-like HicB family nuclease
MRKLTYFAIFESTSDGGYGVYFPDLLGCTSRGDDYAHAEKMAKEALSYHIYEMEKDKDQLPIPSVPDKLNIFEETKEGYIISPVNIYPDLVKNQLDNRAVKTNTTLPAWLKEIAEENNVNYSQLLTTALKEYLQIETNN